MECLRSGEESEYDDEIEESVITEVPPTLSEAPADEAPPADESVAQEPQETQEKEEGDDEEVEADEGET